MSGSKERAAIPSVCIEHGGSRMAWPHLALFFFLCSLFVACRRYHSPIPSVSSMKGGGWAPFSLHPQPCLPGRWPSAPAAPPAHIFHFFSHRSRSLLVIDSSLTHHPHTKGTWVALPFQLHRGNLAWWFELGRLQLQLVQMVTLCFCFRGQNFLKPLHGIG